VADKRAIRDLLIDKRPLVIAHRGASFYAPENTMPAFEKALELGSQIIELDVLLLSDGVPVVIHDTNLRRLAGVDKDIRTLSSLQIKSLDVGSFFGPQFKNASIPLLSEVLEWADGKTALNIEIKPESVTDSFENGIEEKVLHLIRKQKMETQVLISGFDLRTIERFKQHAPEIARGVLYKKQNSSGLKPADLVDSLEAASLHVSKWDLRSKIMTDAAARKIPVLVYTVNRKWQMRRFINKGVKGIFSDKPDVLAKVIERG